MAKHIFKFLNNENLIWVDILRDKYGNINFRHDHPPNKCSWFFQGLCHSAIFIKQQCKLNTVNPDKASLLWDPWCFDIPVALKPTYINMNIDFNHITLNDLVLDNQWDNLGVIDIFGGVLDNSNLSLANVDYDYENYWVCQPKSNCHKISSAVYHFF